MKLALIVEYAFEKTGNIGYAREIAKAAIEYVDLLYEGLL